MGKCVWVWAFVAGAALAGGMGCAHMSVPNGLYPVDVDGWKLDNEGAVYNADTLFDYINGELGDNIYTDSIGEDDTYLLSSKAQTGTP